MANQATEVATTAADQGKQVAGQAMEQAQAVAGVAKEQARSLFDQARDDVRAQADSQTERIADGLRGLAGQVQAMLDGRNDEAGQLPDLARQATQQLETIAGRIGDRGMDGVVQDVTTFARRKPGLFLAGAAALGFVGGRLLRGAQAAQQQGLASSSSTPTSSMTPSQPAQPRLAGATADADEVITLTQSPTSNDTIAVPVGGAS